MNYGNSNSSPKFQNLGIKPKQSPIEIKEKIRKNYKKKVQNCRGVLFDKFRQSFNEQDICNTLTELYKSVLSYSHDTDVEESFLEELKNELIQDELEWWMKEYETSQMENFDWSAMEEDGIICPVCQKNNLIIDCNLVLCSYCNVNIRTSMDISDIKKSIMNSVQNHSALCSKHVQFSVISDFKENHIYMICDSCNEMKYII